MLKEKLRMYPNYCNYFFYDEGEDAVLLVRKIDGKEVYREWFFSTQ